MNHKRSLVLFFTFFVVFLTLISYVHAADEEDKEEEEDYQNIVEFHHVGVLLPLGSSCFGVKDVAFMGAMKVESGLTDSPAIKDGVYFGRIRDDDPSVVLEMTLSQCYIDKKEDGKEPCFSWAMADKTDNFFQWDFIMGGGSEKAYFCFFNSELTLPSAFDVNVKVVNFSPNIPPLNILASFACVFLGLGDFVVAQNMNIDVATIVFGLVGLTGLCWIITAVVCLVNIIARRGKNLVSYLTMMIFGPLGVYCYINGKIKKGLIRTFTLGGVGVCLLTDAFRPTASFNLQKDDSMFPPGAGPLGAPGMGMPGGPGMGMAGPGMGMAGAPNGYRGGPPSMMRGGPGGPPMRGRG